MINFKETVNGYRKNLHRWFELMEDFDYSQIDKLTNNLLCRLKMGGHLYFVGIGKNVPMLNKVIATMRSLGIRAHDIDAVDIMHGDFGVFADYDTVIAVSKSGRTKELEDTLKYVAKHVKTYMVTLSEHSNKLENVTYIHLPVVDELDVLSKVPTTSPVAFQIFFDCLAFAIAEMNGISYPKFLANHQNGAIGESLRNNLKTPDFIPEAYQIKDDPSLFDGLEEDCFKEDCAKESVTPHSTPDIDGPQL